MLQSNVTKGKQERSPMSINPFFNHSVLNLPLQQELCQHIHYEALVSTSRGCPVDELPPTVNMTHLQQRTRICGSESYLMHPADVERIFAGVTTAVYQAIEAFYCSRLERRIGTVWQIVNVLAQEAAVSPILYEAIWAICTHLEERRVHATKVAVERTGETWWMAHILCGDTLASPGSGQDRYIVCIVDVARLRVLAFRFTDHQHLREHYALVLYDAIVLQRRPHRDAAAGVLWHLPRRLIAQDPWAQDCRGACVRLGITLEDQQEDFPFFQDVYENWNRESAARKLRRERWADGFDSYLQKVYGCSPLRTREQLDREFAQQIGYNRDPAWQFPALRDLLPQRVGVTQEGAVFCNGLHYVDELLSYWPAFPVTFRQSEQTEACIWVYLADKMLCQAMARELRRLDGSYRLYRPERKVNDVFHLDTPEACTSSK